MDLRHRKALSLMLRTSAAADLKTIYQAADKSVGRTGTRDSKTFPRSSNFP